MVLNLVQATYAAVAFQMSTTLKYSSLVLGMGLYATHFYPIFQLVDVIRHLCDVIILNIKIHFQKQTYIRNI